jgi:hypothetical protein
MPIDSVMEVDHLDCNVLNNAASNLKPMSGAENGRRAQQKTYQATNKRNNLTYTENGLEAMAERLNCSISMVSMIAVGRHFSSEWDVKILKMARD